MIAASAASAAAEAEFVVGALLAQGWSATAALSVAAQAPHTTSANLAAALLDGGKPRDPEQVRVYFDARVKALGSRSANGGAARADSSSSSQSTGQKRDLRNLYSPPGR